MRQRDAVLDLGDPLVVDVRAALGDQPPRRALGVGDGAGEQIDDTDARGELVAGEVDSWHGAGEHR